MAFEIMLGPRRHAHATLVADYAHGGVWYLVPSLEILLRLCLLGGGGVAHWRVDRWVVVAMRVKRRGAWRICGEPMASCEGLFGRVRVLTITLTPEAAEKLADCWDRGDYDADVLLEAG